MAAAEDIMTQSYLRVNDLSEVVERRPTFVAVGSFDAVHRGHQHLLQSMVAAARQEGARPAVLTFFPHPSLVIHGQKDRFYLSRLDDRVELLAQQGLELIVTHPFDEQVRLTRAADFVDALCRYLDMRQLWGGNFALGYNREGTVPVLRQLGQEKGFAVQTMAAMAEWQGELVSSTRIREALARGDVAEARGCLGRPYRLRGRVVVGDRRGQTIGVPTANLDVWEMQMLPANGVYAAYAWVGSERYQAATNIGVRPTINGHQLTIEAHLLDFSGDLYGREISLDFIDHIRDERKFSGLDTLVAQIKADIAYTREILKTPKN